MPKMAIRALKVT